MVLPEKKDEPNRTAQQNSHRGHDFAMDVHPERYPRELLSRLEEGILEDDLKRHEHDQLGYTIPDLEDRIDDVRNLSRTLMVSGTLILIFAWILTWWVGWDMRSGNTFFTMMWVVGMIIGFGLILWGSIERHRVIRLLRRMRVALAR